ncbi:MAG: hypothetical protein JNL98_18160 [Bryobacterales bacterium]|nr:hypothetical protein [Bryobacterales bacterium]
MPVLLRGLFPAIVLFGLNYYVCQELFQREYIDQLHSIEAAYIGLARYIQENWRDLSWFPLWYGGIPFENTYPPLLHLTSAGLGALTGIGPGQAYHAVSAFWFCLGPVTLYWFAWRISGSVVAAFAAGLIYSVFSPSAWLIPSIVADMGIFHGRRLQTVVVWGEGPHVSGLTLVPLACLLMLMLWRKPSVGRLIAASLMCAATALTNWHAGFTLGMALLCALIVLPDGHGKALRWLVLTALMAYAVAAVWLPPSTIATIQTNARTIGLPETLTPAKIALRWILLGGAAAGLVWLLRRWRAGFAEQFAVLFLALTGTLTLMAEWAKVEILPQAGRYHLQMEMGIALVAGLLLARLVRGHAAWVGGGSIAILIAFSVHPVKQVRRLNREINLRAIDMKATPMYQIGTWLRENRFQDRVFALGATGFWLHVFTDTPNLDGGFSHGRINYQSAVAWYGIQAAEPVDRALLWLKAFGIRAIAVSGQGSTEPYPSPGMAQKFEGVLKPLWAGPHDVLYAVPGASTLAYRIAPEAVLRQAPGVSEDLRPYVSAIEAEGAPLRSHWTSPRSLRIAGALRRRDVVSLQVSFHRGWSAMAGGRRVPVRADGLGQMIVEPECDGPCTVDVFYDGGLERRICGLLPAAALGLALLALRRFPGFAQIT